VSSPAPRLRRADCSGPGLRRVRRGRGFAYVDPDGERVDDPEVLERISGLVIPPAWQEVWICPYPMGHIQATGIDAAGRKQYLYHQKWRARRDRRKFEDMIEFARALPALRRRVARLLKEGADSDDPRVLLSRDRVLACAVRLLDCGFFRIGSEDYAVQNESYGLATMRKEHVTLGDGEKMVFDYAVCRASYIDPRVIDAYQGGLVITPAVERAGYPTEAGPLPIHDPAIAAAVLDLIDGREAASGLERVA
jgi:DNA topoisomerase-1